MWPLSPSSLTHASHFCMDFCICSGDCADGSLPRNRKVNSLIVCPLGFGTYRLRRLNNTGPDIFRGESCRSTAVHSNSSCDFEATQITHDAEDDGALVKLARAPA